MSKQTVSITTSGGIMGSMLDDMSLTDIINYIEKEVSKNRPVFVEGHDLFACLKAINREINNLKGVTK